MVDTHRKKIFWVLLALVPLWFLHPASAKEIDKSGILIASDNNIDVNITISHIGETGYLAANPSILQLNIDMKNKTNRPMQFVTTHNWRSDGMKLESLGVDDLLPPQYENGKSGVVMGLGLIANIFIPGAGMAAAAKTKMDKTKVDATRQAQWNRLVSALLQKKLIPAGEKSSGVDFIRQDSNVTAILLEYKTDGVSELLKIDFPPLINSDPNTAALQAPRP